MKLDADDLRILAALQQDGSLSNVELARRIHLSPSPCLMRVKALQAADLIRVAVAEIAALERFILNQLTPFPGIEKSRSSFALKQVRYKTALPLPLLLPLL